MDITPRNLRSIMGRFATGVCVITGRMPEGDAVGVTINSLTSVSLTPPLLLFCLSQTSAVFSAFSGEKPSLFRVHILGASQQELSQRMTVFRPNDEAFGGLDEAGCPILPGSIAWLRCRSQDAFDAGDHRIILGHVEAMEMGETHEPLIYHRSRYSVLAPFTDDMAS